MADTQVGKVRDGDGLYGPRYRITINGAPTKLIVEKSAPPKYRMPQFWDVIEGDNPDNVLFDANSLEAAVGVVRLIVGLALAEGR